MSTLERIKLLAKQKNMSLRSLATEAGLGPTTIYNWKNRTPDAANLAKVAQVLAVSSDYLLNGSQPKDHSNPTVDLAQDGVYLYDGQELSAADMTIIRNILERIRN